MVATRQPGILGAQASGTLPDPAGATPPPGRAQRHAKAAGAQKEPPPPPPPPPPKEEHLGAVPDIDSHVGKPVKLNANDSAQCAHLVKVLASAPPTQPKQWAEGTHLSAKNVEAMPVGTPIASGWDDGFYPNGSSGQHAGFFAGALKNAKTGDVEGFYIVEQYAGLTKIARREVYFDPVAHKKKDTYFYRGGDYAVIKW